MLPQRILRSLWATLDNVSDEVGEDYLGKGYLLKYEGWGGFCVEDIWSKIEEEQKNRGIDTCGEEAQHEREEACYKYAEEQSYNIIENDWMRELIERGYDFIDGGYDKGGLYGRTWALFKGTNLSMRRRINQEAPHGLLPY